MDAGRTVSAEEEVWTSREAARFLQISGQTLRKALKFQNLHPHKLGRRYVLLR
ncbi:hypothetical protein HS125_13930 [bacterium]|nr:hypothetical protein [bacterium]